MKKEKSSEESGGKGITYDMREIQSDPIFWYCFVGFEF